MTTDELTRPLPDDVNKLKALLVSLQAARASEADRLRHAVQDRQDLTLELGTYRDKLGYAKKQIGILEGAHEAGGHAALEMVTQALASPRKPSLIKKVLASLLLRYARRAARSEQYAQAQTLYETIALFAPRPFLLKQIGTMLYHQHYYQSAVDVLVPAQKFMPGDRDVNFLLQASESILAEAKGRPRV